KKRGAQKRDKAHADARVALENHGTDPVKTARPPGTPVIASDAALQSGQSLICEHRLPNGRQLSERDCALYSAARTAAFSSARAASSAAAVASPWATLSSIMPLLAWLWAILPLREAMPVPAPPPVKPPSV